MEGRALPYHRGVGKGQRRGGNLLSFVAHRAELLEFPEVLRLLAQETASPQGRDRALTLAPLATYHEVIEALSETTEARASRAKEGDPPFGAPPEIRPILARAAVEGAVLEGIDLVAIRATLGVARQLRSYGGRARAITPSLGIRLSRLLALPDLEAALSASLTPEGELLDSASPRLRQLRRLRETLRARILRSLERLLDSPGLEPALQERFITIRNGRYVLPVRADAARTLPGIVHDRSASGATLFIEPASVVEANNDLTKLILDEQEEIQRILAALTREVRAHLPVLEALVDELGRLDLAFAKARLADRFGALAPEVSPGPVRLIHARHPLLLAQGRGRVGTPPVVPVDLILGESARGLVITGPNAGGKTVALKTLGLLCLMAQAGLHLPVEEGSRLPVFRHVFPVIGDEQSLAQNLSTFSSFVGQVKGVLELADDTSLILIDELGAGTDPSEGAALAQALVEIFLAKGSWVVATTHLEPLKVFAALHPEVENATVEFDEERIEPTFRLIYGRPGRSYALAIATKLGLPQDLIARARSHLSSESRRLADLLQSLEERERSWEAREAEGSALEDRLAELRVEAETLLERARQEARSRAEKARDEAHRLIVETRRQVQAEMERLKAEAASRRSAEEALRRLRRVEAELPPPAQEEILPLDADEVLIPSLGLRGRIVEERDGLVMVQAGALTVRVPRAQLGAPPGKPKAPGPGKVRLPEKSGVSPELLLLGRTTEEARDLVVKYLDDAVLAGLPRVRLVHGKGTGALRKAVQAVLKEHPLVTGFRFGAPHEGGTGATVVELEIQ